jgi:hypothetical protein
MHGQAEDTAGGLFTYQEIAHPLPQVGQGFLPGGDFLLGRQPLLHLPDFRPQVILTMGQDSLDSFQKTGQDFLRRGFKNDKIEAFPRDSAIA